MMLAECMNVCVCARFMCGLETLKYYGLDFRYVFSWHFSFLSLFHTRFRCYERCFERVFFLEKSIQRKEIFRQEKKVSVVVVVVVVVGSCL